DHAMAFDDTQEGLLEHAGALASGSGNFGGSRGNVDADGLTPEEREDEANDQYTSFILDEIILTEASLLSKFCNSFANFGRRRGEEQGKHDEKITSLQTDIGNTAQQANEIRSYFDTPKASALATGDMPGFDSKALGGEKGSYMLMKDHQGQLYIYDH